MILPMNVCTDVRREQFEPTALNNRQERLNG